MERKFMKRPGPVVLTVQAYTWSYSKDAPQHVIAYARAHHASLSPERCEEIARRSLECLPRPVYAA